MSFDLATQLAIRQFAGNPEWKPLSNVDGAPVDLTAGVDLESAPAALLDVELRDNLRHRTGRVSVTDVQDSTNYEVEVRTQTATATSAGSATEDGIIQKITRAVNGLRTNVRARNVDTDGDNNFEESWIESNHSCITVSSVNNNYTYNLTIDGVLIEFDSDGSATEVEVINGIRDQIDQSSAPADAISEDTTGNGDVDTLFIAPVNAGTLEITDVDSDLTLEATGQETDNPFYGIASSSTGRLSLDSDATRATVLFFATFREGEKPDQAPGGWRLVDKFDDVDYRGLTREQSLQMVSMYRRGYLQVIEESGSIRQANIGTAMKEN